MRYDRSLTALYSAIQAVLWMSVCIATGFAAVYLQSLDYSNTQLGVILAAGSLCSAALGLTISAVIDSDVRRSAAWFIPPLLALQAVMLVLLLVFRTKGTALSVSYMLYITFCLAMTSLIPKMYIDYLHLGRRINFGVARGIGSLAFVLISALMGVVVEAAGVRVLSIFALGLCAAQLVLCRSFSHGLAAASTNERNRARHGSSLPAFLKANPRFCMLLLGLVFLFFAHNTFGSFAINVARNVGGGTATMGYLTAFMAAVEIPVMLFFSRLRGRWSTATILRFSFVFFSLKIAAITAARSIPALFLAVILQAPSYALEAVAIVGYVDEVIPFEDSAKAQSLTNVMTALSSVFTSVVAGRLFDTMTVTQTLMIACIVCVAGTVITQFGLQSTARIDESSGT